MDNQVKNIMLNMYPKKEPQYIEEGENDTNLMNYEEAFSKHKSAFVPISKMIKYLEQQK